MRRYLYWVIRFVPNPISGEFVNIGVLAGNNDSDWSIRLMQDLSRANVLGGRPDAIQPWCDELQTAVSYQDAITPEAFGQGRTLTVSYMAHLSERSNNLAQLSEPNFTIAENAAAAVDGLFRIFVSQESSCERDLSQSDGHK